MRVAIVGSRPRWEGESRGTASAISEARRQQKPVVVIGPDGEVTG